jgi:alginate O-acetyltransferase complex protein AlgI
MLFNSLSFLLAFLPVTVIGYFLLARRNNVFAAGWLAAASLFFYGWWDVRYVPLLLSSIAVNYGCAYRIRESSEPSQKKRWLIISVAANLLLLGYYKYANFFLSTTGALSGASFQALDIVLPIGISFFTFTQIAFLVDTYQGKVKEYRFIHYVLFVTYFPHLIAGPVLHHKEMMPQFADDKNYRPSSANFAVGLTIFCIGLAKKVLIADNLAPYANDVFNSPEEPSFFIAWGGVLAYTFQLYFDFSGYSDMAIGLSRLFGVRLPLNFDSPYKAANISEFWRRWHMTLSRFLRDYFYIALGGNRLGRTRRYVNLMITMVLGGLWHGAGWNFAIWGGLHGLYLVVNQVWIGLADRFRLPREIPVWKWVATAITFFAVCFAWVFFRAADLAIASEIIRGMTGGFGISVPDVIGARLGSLRLAVESSGITFFQGGGARFVETWSWVTAGAAIAFILPNTQQIVRRFDPALEPVGTTNDAREQRLVWLPSPPWAIAMGLLMVAGLLSLNRPSEFLYFQF